MILAGKMISVAGPSKIKKTTRPRGGKHLKDEDDFKALVVELFGANPGHNAEGEWTASASDIMREPGYLTKFHADRALVEKVRLSTPAAGTQRARAARWRASTHSGHAPPHIVGTFTPLRTSTHKVLGDGRFLVTPCTFLCPFENAQCKGRNRLNRFGGFSQLYKHWTKKVCAHLSCVRTRAQACAPHARTCAHTHAQHGDNPAAAALIVRFKAILKKKKMSVEQLNAVAPFAQLEEDGYEQLRSPNDVPSQDMFSYNFEINSLAHGDWLAAVGNI